MSDLGLLTLLRHTLQCRMFRCVVLDTLHADEDAYSRINCAFFLSALSLLAVIAASLE